MGNTGRYNDIKLTSAFILVSGWTVYKYAYVQLKKKKSLKNSKIDG